MPRAGLFKIAARTSREAWWRVLGQRHAQIPLPGAFQPYNHTLPDRYPWLFEFARKSLLGIARPQLLSFGCSRGEEAFALRKYFPRADIAGIDIDPHNIACCLARARAEQSEMRFTCAATTAAERTASFDAILCLAVLCHGDLSAYAAQRCDPVLWFDDFASTVADFSRCLKPGGLLLLHTTNFRFCDTSAYGRFETVLEAQPGQLASDVLFDRNNQLMEGERYCPVAFRKHGGSL